MMTLSFGFFRNPGLSTSLVKFGLGGSLKPAALSLVGSSVDDYLMVLSLLIRLIAFKLMARGLTAAIIDACCSLLLALLFVSL